MLVSYQISSKIPDYMVREFELTMQGLVIQLNLQQSQIWQSSQIVQQMSNCPSLRLYQHFFPSPRNHAMKNHLCTHT